MEREKKKGTEQMTPDMIHCFLEDLKRRGRSEASLDNYRCILSKFYEELPKEKEIDARTGKDWETRMKRQGLSLRTVNNRISVWNSFTRYLGRREWQVGELSLDYDQVQPELTRAEYLRLLQTARRMEKRKSYLLIKILGGAGMRIQELPQLTVESVRQGTVKLECHNKKQKRVLHLPEMLQKELMEYAKNEGITSGPLFVTQEGVPLPRTSVYRYVNYISHDALVSEEKANPRCLWKMYRSTYDGIRANIDLLTAQAYERMMENEQLSVGWDGL